MSRAGINTKVCAVTVAYNSPEELERLLASLTGQDNSLRGLIVVDNSDQAYLAANKKIFESCSNRFTLSRYLKSEHNVGSAGGFRRGMQIAHENHCDWVWLLDQDGTISHSCLTELLKCSEEGDILCPKTVDIEQPNPTLPTVYAESFLGGSYSVISPSTNCQINGFATHATLISKRALDTIGYYDDAFFFVGYEDGDYGLRAVEAGLVIFFVEQAEAQHPNLILKKAQGTLTSARLEQRQAKHRDLEPRTLDRIAARNAKEAGKNWARTIDKILPYFLGYITALNGQAPCSRTRSISIFSRLYMVRKHLRPWKFGIAVVYSTSRVLCHKIGGQRGIALMATLRLYMTCLAHSLRGDWPYTSIEQLCREILGSKRRE
jgi:GT2 family glycosyltransferase